MNPKLKNILLLAVIAILIGAFWWFDLGRFLSFQYLQDQRATLIALRTAHPLGMSVGFFVIYVAVTALSVPGAAILTLAGGAIFGLIWGTVLVSFASTLGATCAFLVSRHILRASIQQKFGDKLSAINEGVRKDGPFYLFTLRLVPVFPFFLINLLLGLTPMATRTFFWVSQLGMLAGTLVYVNAGTELARLTSASGILSPRLLGAFVLLGIFPILARKAVALLRKTTPTAAEGGAQ